MFEFLGVVFLGILIWIWFTSDELDIVIKVDNKELFSYHKDADEKDDKKNKKDLK